MNAIDKYNAHLLFNYPLSDFDIRSNGELCVIRWYNVVGHFIKWIRNFHGEVTVKVNKVVKETLEKIYQHNDAANPKDYSTMFYLKKERQGWFFNGSDPFSDYYPAYYLGVSILSNIRFVDYRQERRKIKLMREIEQAAESLMNQLDIYPLWTFGKHWANKKEEEYVLPWDWNA